MSTFVDHVPDLQLTPEAIVRRKCWTGDDGYPDGEGVTLSPPEVWCAGKMREVFVWSRPGEFMFAFTVDDMLATDWYITARKL